MNDRPELTDPDAYIGAITAKIGERDPLEVLARTPGLLRERLAAHAPETLRSRPFDGKWSALEVFGHLLDAEFVYGYRARAIYCEDVYKRQLYICTEQGRVFKIVPEAGIVDENMNGIADGCEEGDPADLDGDGTVDSTDLAILLAAWGDCAGACVADINGDGEVDSGDLAELLAAWG